MHESRASAVQPSRSILPKRHTVAPHRLGSLAVLHGRRCGTDTWIFAGLWLLLTTLATLGLGEHYVIDLVIAVPFAVAVEAAVTSRGRASWAARRDALVAGSTLTLVSMLLVRWAPAALAASVPATGALVLAAVAVPIALHMRLSASTSVAAPAAASP